MGLDVYLTHYKDFEKSQALEKEYEDRSEALWKGKAYEEYTPEERDEIRNKSKAIAKELGLDEWGEDKTFKEDIQKDSKKYPDHYFKIGYFRSSYNDGGINRVLKNMGIPDLYDIFQVGEDYENPLTVDWSLALRRVQEVIDLLDRAQNRAEGKYRAFDVPARNLFRQHESGVTNEREALEVFKDSLKNATDFESYSNAQGHFFKEGIKVLALIQGTDVLKQPALYAIVEREKDDLKWYREALEIVRETCVFVLKHKDPQNFRLYWSA